MKRAWLFDEVQLMHQGIQRHYLLYTPTVSRPLTPLPLVIGLHGGYSCAKRFSLTTDFNALASSEGFLVAYPEGYNRHWSDGRPGVNDDIDDVGFIASLITDIQRHRAVDTRRIYVVGISNGGHMVHRLAAELSQTIAAFATVASALSVPLYSQIKTKIPVSLLMINSKLDKFVTFNGELSRRGKGGDMLSIIDTFEFWRQRGECHLTEGSDLLSLMPAAKIQAGDIELTRYINPESKTEVVLIVLAQGGHTWPGGFRQPSWLVGETPQDINASELTWSFFQNHYLGEANQ